MHGLGSQPVDDTVHLQATDQYEKPHEEEDSGPLNLGEHKLQRLFAVRHGEQQQQGCTRHSDGAALQPPVGNEAVAAEQSDRKRQREQAAHQKPPAADKATELDVHDALEVLVGLSKLLPVDEKDDTDGQHKGNDTGQGEIPDEIREAEFLHLAGNHDIGRVTNHGAGAADIGCKNLRHHERQRRDLQILRQREGNRHGEQHRGHIVQDG